MTDGVESAVEQAKAVAAGKRVMVIGGASIAQQCIRARLVDELQIRVLPVLLGEGLRLFEHLGTEQIQLETLSVTESAASTDLRFHFAARPKMP